MPAMEIRGPIVDSTTGKAGRLTVNDTASGVTVEADAKAGRSLWRVVPLFDDECRYLGYGIRNEYEGKYLQASAPGAGVTVVAADKVDSLAGWYLRPVGALSDPLYALVAGPTFYVGHVDLTVSGLGPWSSGMQVICGDWIGGNPANQSWSFNLPGS